MQTRNFLKEITFFHGNVFFLLILKRKERIKKAIKLIKCSFVYKTYI
jgi:hypothetical protein